MNSKLLSKRRKDINNGIYLGHPTYIIHRADIAALFPGYANSNGAGAYFDIDTASYENGTIRIELKELDRIELHISNIESGFMLSGNKFHPLPIGSTLDKRTGTFSWIPGPGFYGNYRLVFIKKGPEDELSKKEIHLRIVPKSGTGG